MKILADIEFQPLEESLQDDFNIEMDFAAAQEHVPEAEQNNRVIKECVRATFHIYHMVMSKENGADHGDGSSKETDLLSSKASCFKVLQP